MCLSEVQVGLSLSPAGDRMHSLFLSVLAVKNLGHGDIRVTHVVPHMLSRTISGLIARIGRVRFSAKTVCQHLRAKWISGVYVRHLPSTCLCLRQQGLQDRRGFRPHAARSAPFPSPRFVRDH
jgi:hypothetical protein